ncbi:hypothetical protein AO384_0386 [Moraxella catarrhalis]|uniref:Lipoyl-binding domain-containing protein n=1 Tax=Moraxella catarrhalis TaxID=480 RepID=A0A198UMY0_MORCA|nr:hypothetical protein AO384_0386 [Moraxella catarrhalis]
MAEIKAPVFPESVQGTIVEWHVAEGEAVSRDQLLAEVETDKVVLEIAAPDDGVITSIVKNVDDTVLSAEVVAIFEAGASAGEAPSYRRKWLRFLRQVHQQAKHHQKMVSCQKTKLIKVRPLIQHRLQHQYNQ